MAGGCVFGLLRLWQEHTRAAVVQILYNAMRCCSAGGTNWHGLRCVIHQRLSAVVHCRRELQAALGEFTGTAANQLTMVIE